MKSWCKKLFKEIALFPPKITLDKNYAYPFIPMEDLKGEFKYVTAPHKKVWTGTGGAKFENGDTLFARITPCLQNGKIAQAKDLQNGKGFGSTEYFVFRGIKNISDSDFIYYLSQNEDFRKYAIGSMVGASGRQRADATFVGKFEVNLPPLLTQRRIASILSAYDDLIENNLKRIKLLEELAQRTYEEWFVKFTVNGEKLLLNKETGLPEGWERKKLDEVADINKNNIKKGFEGEIKYVDISSVSTGSIDSCTQYNIQDAPGRARRVLMHGDIIWSCVRPNRKSYSLVWKPTDNLIGSTGFAVISAKLLPVCYLYFSVTSEEFVGYLTSRATGAAYPAVTHKDFENADIVVPSEDLLRYSDIKITPLFEIISNLKNQNRLLKQSRDILLPKLMSGAIDLEQAENASLSLAAEPEIFYS